MGSICTQGEVTILNSKKAKVCLSHKLDISSPIFSEPGDSFYSEYQLHVKPLDLGLYSEVTLCTKQANKKLRTVKIISKSCLPAIIIDQKLIHKVVERIKTLGCKDLVKFYKVYENKDSFYVVYEYFKDGSLDDWVEEKGVSEENVVKVVKSVINVALLLDQAGFAQYELRPDNVFISEGFGVKLSLFTVRCLMQERFWASKTQKKLEKEIKAQVLTLAYFCLTKTLVLNPGEIFANKNFQNFSPACQDLLHKLNPEDSTILTEILQLI